MSGNALTQVLKAETLTGVIQDIKAGVPKVLPDKFYTSNKSVVGDTLRYKVTEGSRSNARAVDRAQPASEYTPKVVSKRTVTMPNYKEALTLDPHDLENLQSDDGMVQETGRDEVARQVGDLATTVVNSTHTAIHKMAFGGGKIWLDSDGHHLTSSSGAVVTIDANIPAVNLTQFKLIDGSTDIITATWATATTPIIKQIAQIKTTAIQRTGYPIGVCVYTDTILGYMIANNDIQALMQSNAALTTALESGVIPNGFLGIKEWVNGSAALYEDKSGDLQGIMGDDNIAFFPEMNSAWYQNAEGSAAVPAGGSSIEASMATKQAKGLYSYSWGTMNPVTYKVVTGIVQLPILLVPSAVWYGDVTP